MTKHHGSRWLSAGLMLAGALVSGGWDWGCSHNEGIRLLAEPEGAFYVYPSCAGAMGKVAPMQVQKGSSTRAIPKPDAK